MRSPLEGRAGSRQLIWLTTLLFTGGCSTAQLHPELVADAAKVRVVRDSAGVGGCKFLGALSATEEPGYTSRAGIVYDPGTPAITLLQVKANSRGADTVEVTSSGQSYRSASNGRAYTLTTLTGNAYLCGTASQPTEATSTVPAVAPKKPTEVQPESRWSLSIDTSGRDASRLLTATVPSDPPGSSLQMYCDELKPTPHLSGRLWIGDNRVRPLDPPYDDRSTVTLVFLGSRRVTMSMDVQAFEGSLAFFSADAHAVIPLLKDGRAVLAQIALLDGTSRTLTFDVRGFADAFGAGLSACDAAPIEQDKAVFGRAGNATIRLKVVSVTGPRSAEFAALEHGREIWVYSDADVQGDRVVALYSSDGDKNVVPDCRLDNTLRATCSVTEEGDTLVVEIDAHDVRKAARS